MRRVCGLLAVAVTAVAAGGPAAAAPAGCHLTQFLHLNVTMEGLRPMVDATINGRAERFLADSGAFYSDISPGKAAELGLRLEPLPTWFRVHGVNGSATTSLATVKSLGLAGASLADVKFLVAGSEVGGSAGLLGQNVLGIADTEYDLAHGLIRLIRPQGCKGAAVVYWASTGPISSVTLEERNDANPHTIGTVTVNGVKMRAVFDTGASRSVMTLAAAARVGIKPGGEGVRQVGTSGGLGRERVATYVVPIDSLKLGDGEEIRRTHIQAAALDIGGPDLLIGADFFLSHRVYVANQERRLFFTYDGGPVFNVTPSRVVDAGGAVGAVEASGPAPTDAAGLAARGAAFLSRRDVPHALADYDAAVALAPADAHIRYGRAEARVRSGDRSGAMADLEEAVRLAPGDAEVRYARATMRLRAGNRAGATEDLDALNGSLPAAADMRLALAGMFGAVDRPADQMTQWDDWLRYHPDDSRRASALNARCWARAQTGADLAKALADCDAAVRAQPKQASYLDSRGLVRLRLGDAPRAIRDYDAALAIDPKLAWSLYGRALAKRRAGQAGADADEAAALAINPRLPDEAKRIGLVQ